MAVGIDAGGNVRSGAICAWAGIALRGIRDVMPDDDPYAKTRLRAAMQVNDDMRRDEPWLWLFANVATWIVHPWVSLLLWWLARPTRWAVRATPDWATVVDSALRVCNSPFAKAISVEDKWASRNPP
jgi:hypothetical protein